MRLIDADALRKQLAIIAIDNFCLDNSYQKFIDALKAVNEAVENEPTVEAIPIEFIMRKCEILREMQLTCSDFDDESLWKSYMDEEHYLNLLMMTWAKRKEE